MAQDTTEWGLMRSVRFSQEIDQWLLKRAKDNMRSINGEVSHILMQEKEREATAQE